MDEPKPSRRPRDRDPAQPTNFAERMFKSSPRTPSSHLQLSNPNPPPVPSCHSPAATSPRKTILAPHVVVSHPEADPEDFSRRLKISTPPPQPPPSHKADPAGQTIPSQHRSYSNETHNCAFSDATSSSSPPRNTPTSHQRDPPASRQLFDHRKDDPVRFAVLVRPSSTGARPPPTPKSSGDYVSASSTSSYAHSLTSSFTLSSSGMTDNSSASSALFFRTSYSLFAEPSRRASASSQSPTPNRTLPSRSANTAYRQRTTTIEYI
ncbi:hypothetical protein P692DRAFT_20872018 [Suillus brevipes Sb2]|nr:hypothetical protein P692DRAFT_20872018 [Suillus brevipes Sb2]